MESSVCIVSASDTSDFVTVVSVGTEDNKQLQNEDKSSAYVTVLKIGDNLGESPGILEEVLVYRLPGERLGFGLKFEGGVRAKELVKRLFIQSCAQDSPASRATSSWGPLTEGDEILEIDGVPVNSLSRIDCVRRLKDSNLVIKLLVKHISVSVGSKSVEDLPLVVSAEAKRTPPPPPPIPPRKIPRKLIKTPNVAPPKPPDVEPPAPPIRQPQGDINGFKTRLSPRNSNRSLQSKSPEVTKKDRKLSNGLEPPEAEIYMDLISSQNSTYSLSESDDTGSSISTVIDRLGSSVAGSLPSTPTAIQKHLDFMNHYEDDGDFIDNNYLYSVNNNEDPFSEHKLKLVELNTENSPLQPPVSFQDAALSYGNEDVRPMEAAVKTALAVTVGEVDVVDSNGNYIEAQENIIAPIRNMQNVEKWQRDVSKEELPRLVDFLPKSKKDEDSINMVKLFLENEQRTSHNDFVPSQNTSYDFDADASLEVPNWNSEFYRWNSSSQLATIGEDEEEGSTDCYHRSSLPVSTPIVIVESADAKDTNVSDENGVAVDTNEDNSLDMDYILLNSRQPPDGHEFPDGNEFNEPTEKPKQEQKPSPFYERKWEQSATSVKDKIAQFSNSNIAVKQSKSVENLFESTSKVEPLKKLENTVKTNTETTTNFSEAAHIPDGSSKIEPPSIISKLHMRSQSLVDISCTEPNKVDKWAAIMEQRKSKLSKLKGLIIPESTVECDATDAPVINLPEIKSNINVPKFNFSSRLNCHNETTPLNVEITASNTKSVFSTSNDTEKQQSLPKYSPAFKRKSLQIYGDNKSLPYTNKQKPAIEHKLLIIEQMNVEETKIESKTQNYLPILNLTEPSKSLESITSPARSDSSFEYISSFAKSKTSTKNYKLEEDSDNDSAVSSSQSSYISRTSPPSSPVNTRYVPKKYSVANQVEEDANRVSKTTNIDAVNRKNILASAKCRSAKELIEEKEQRDIVKVKETKTEVKPTETKLTNVISLQKEVVTPTPPRRWSLEVATPPALKEEKPRRKVEERYKPTSQRTENVPVIKKPINIMPTNRFSTIQNSASVTDLRKNFEKLSENNKKKPEVPKPEVHQPRLSRLSINLSTDNLVAEKSRPAEENVITVITNEQKSDLIDGVLKEFPDDKLLRENIKVLTLWPGVVGGSIGLTLAGGSDCETKHITVHKVRTGSAAYKNGVLEKGDRILSINGKFMKNVTHSQSVATLKEPVGTVILIVHKEKDKCASPVKTVVKSLKEPTQKLSEIPENSNSTVLSSENITLHKDAAGLGFSVEGGYDSPLGNLPLLVKRIFKGCAADKSGKLNVGDEILEINHTNVTQMSRMDAWLMMKKLPDGNVVIKVRRKT